MNPFGLLVVAIGALLVYGGAKGAGLVKAQTTTTTATAQPSVGQQLNIVTSGGTLVP